MSFVRRRPRLSAVLAVVLIWWLSGVVHSMQDNRKVARMTENMKTVCVGRLLIDVPADAQISMGGAFIDGIFFSAHEEDEASFHARVAKRQAELTAERDYKGRQSLVRVRPLRTPELAGSLLAYDRFHGELVEKGEKIVYDNVKLEGFLHGNGLSFDLLSFLYPINELEMVDKLLGQMRVSSGDMPPPEAAFCADHAWFTGPLSANQGERVTLFIGVPGHPDMAIAFATMVGGAPAPGLLARDAAAAERDFPILRMAFTNLRAGQRTVDGRGGEELLQRVRELNFTTTYLFNLEVPGKQGDVMRPMITLELQTGLKPRPGAGPVQTSLSESALISLWDKLAASIRIRDIKAPATVPPPGAALGTQVLAGARCPAAGWWRCADAGAREQVQGGDTQWLALGQRAPQALLLPPQGLWDKLRGVQSSHARQTPSNWTLVNRRHRPRPPIPAGRLAAQTPPAADTAPATASDGAPGQQRRTDEPCTASGWWRCDDSRALDGARWFARGELLPAATFPVALDAVRAGGPEHVRRRVSWTLMRVDEEGRSATPSASGDDTAAGAA